MPRIPARAAAALRSPAARRLARCLLGCALAALAARPTRPAESASRARWAAAARAPTAAGE